MGRLQDYLPKFRQTGARLVALSVDTPGQLEKLSKRLKLTFPLYRVPIQVVQQLHLQEGERTHARPATFIVNAEGRIVYQHIGKNVFDRPKESTLLQKVQQM